ncbi:MAG: glycine cleavage system protein GcvH [Desulfovibrio sp.]|nr:glycine cleavage system protein GcvH [Desulfovibrio sp.]
MKDVSELILPDGCGFHEEHTWARVDGEDVLVGISDYAQDQLGEVVFVELPETERVFAAGESFGTVESIKAVNELHMPVTGQVAAINGDLEDTPSLVNANCYERGWMLRVRPENPADVDALMQADAYREFLRRL